jgi:hypothetical protein
LGNKYRINGVLANSYSIPQLLGIARNLQIVKASNKMTAAQITQLIVNKLGGSPSGKPHFELNGVPHTLLLDGRVMRGTRAKQWKLLTAAEKNTIGKKILSDANFGEWKKMPRDDQFQTLLAMVTKPKTPTPPPVPAAASASASASASSSGSANSFARELERHMLTHKYNKFIKNSFGNKYAHLIKNTNANNLKAIVDALPKGKRGQPLQVNVNREMIKFVKNLKKKRQLSSLKKAYYNKIVVSQNLRSILKNHVNEYKRTLTNIAFTEKDGKFPTQADVKKRIVGWVRSRFPRKVKLGPREVENVVTGEKRMVYPSPPSPNRRTPSVPKVSVNRISPLQVKRRSPAYKRPRKAKPKYTGPAVGPVKAPPPGGWPKGYSSNSTVNGSRRGSGSSH